MPLSSDGGLSWKSGGDAFRERHDRRLPPVTSARVCPSLRKLHAQTNNQVVVIRDVLLAGSTSDLFRLHRDDSEATLNHVRHRSQCANFTRKHCCLEPSSRSGNFMCYAFAFSQRFSFKVARIGWSHVALVIFFVPRPGPMSSNKLTLRAVTICCWNCSRNATGRETGCGRGPCCGCDHFLRNHCYQYAA